MTGLGIQNENATAVFSNHYQAIAVLILLAVWCWVDVWPRGRLDPNRPDAHRTDFTVYTVAGKAAIAGENPYAVTNARGWGYLYLPLFALIVSPLANFPEGWQCVVWFWISIACLYGAFHEFTLLDGWAFPREASDKVDRLASWGGIICMVGFSLSTLNCLQRGQVGILQLYLTLLGARMILTSTTWKSAGVGGAILAGAIILKISPALPTVILIGGLVLMTTRMYRSARTSTILRPCSAAFGLVIGLVIGIWILPASIVGWHQNQMNLETWRRQVLARTNDLSNDPFAGDSHSTKNQSPMNGFWLLGNTLMSKEQFRYGTRGLSPMDMPSGRFVLTTVRCVSIVLTAVALLAILWRGGSSSLLVAFALANAATLLVLPIARGHYFMAMWPAAVWVPRWLNTAWTRGEQDTPIDPRFGEDSYAGQNVGNETSIFISSLALTQIPPILLILHYVLERYTGPLGVLGIGVWLWLLLLTVALLTNRPVPFNLDTQRRSLSNSSF